MLKKHMRPDQENPQGSIYDSIVGKEKILVL